MRYCSQCGSEVQGGAQFCANCGYNLTQSTSRPASGPATRLVDQPGIQAPLSRIGPLSGPQKGALLVLFIGGLLGFIGLFVNWSDGGSSVGGYLKHGFGDNPMPWWASVIALGAIAGVIVTVLNIVSTVRKSAFPPNGQLRLGGILMAVCPLAAHVGLMIWIVVEFQRAGAGEVWALIWEVDGPGIWISLTGGILVIWAAWIGDKVSSLKF